MTKKQTSGIYRIRNTTTGKVYIGQSKNIEKRIEQHKDKFKNGTHINKGLQEDFNKGHRFIYEIVEETKSSNRSTLDEKEEYYIKKYDSKRNGYNQTWGGRTDKYASKSYRKQINMSNQSNSLASKKISNGTFQSRIEKKIYQTQIGIKPIQLANDPILREKQIKFAKQYGNESKYIELMPKASLPKKPKKSIKTNGSQKTNNSKKQKNSRKWKNGTWQERVEQKIKNTDNEIGKKSKKYGKNKGQKKETFQIKIDRKIKNTEKPIKKTANKTEKSNSDKGSIQDIIKSIKANENNMEGKKEFKLRFCPICGEEIYENQNYCIKCGFDLKNTRLRFKYTKDNPY